jgi:exosortase E/protease (VPEID-CTERM system)
MLDIASSRRANLAAAAGAGLLVPLLSYLAQDGWRPLAGATLDLTRAILQLYEPDVVVDLLDRKIRVGNFQVTILENCSGYEGIGLVTAFLSIYLWAFRRNLRFPHAFLLFPIGVSSVWVLNAVRLAALTSIGAHISPQVALHGFHSLAGWIAFLVVTLTIMVLAQRSAFFTGAIATHRVARRDDRLAVAFLAPFIALMLSSIVMAASAPNDHALYPVKVAAVAFALWLYRDVYRGSSWRISGEAGLAGIVVGAAWIATDPDPAAGARLGAWLAQQSATATIVWLGLRLVGSVVLVPIAEELAFRGFLYRWLISRKFESVSFGQFSLIALFANSLLFGMLHERWLAASLSGVLFTLVMWRTQRLSAPIIAHAVANIIICTWAIGFKQWSLL